MIRNAIIITKIIIIRWQAFSFSSIHNLVTISFWILFLLVIEFFFLKFHLRKEPGKRESKKLWLECKLEYVTIDLMDVKLHGYICSGFCEKQIIKPDECCAGRVAIIKIKFSWSYPRLLDDSLTVLDRHSNPNVDSKSCLVRMSPRIADLASGSSIFGSLADPRLVLITPPF